MREITSNKDFDISYGISSIGITTTGVTVVTTTGGNYHGIAMMAGTTKTSVFVYDASAGTTGNIVDVILVVASGTGWSDKYIPVFVKKGLTVSVTGTGAKGVVYFSPKG